MDNNERQILKCQLDKIYELLKEVDKHKIVGTPEYKIEYELEQINMKLKIPFND